jgi:hypothetical protein
MHLIQAQPRTPLSLPGELTDEQSRPLQFSKPAIGL